MDITVHVLFEPGKNDWVTSRVVNICRHYEKEHELFSMPSHDKTGPLLNFAREIAQTVGMSSTGGEE